MKDNAVSGAYRKKIEQSKKEEQEYGAGKENFVVCEKCNAVYYHKSWHHGFTDYKHLGENKNISFAICPACEMIRDGKFEGRVVFENVPTEYIEGVLNNIKNTGDRAYKRDPMDRIIKVKSQKSKIKNTSTIEVLTTENQLARIIGQQVARAYKNAKVDIKWSKEESAARIVVRFA